MNKDYKDIRFDGIKCLTVKDLNGVLERLYNKGDGLRSEVKVSTPMSVGQIEALLKGGMTPYQILQGQALTNKKIDELTDVMKHTNGFLVQILDVLKNNGVKNVE